MTTCRQLRSLAFFALVASALSSLPSQAAWYWPFGYDEDSTNAPPRLHRLLEKANDYIELAEDASYDGDGDKAVENYRLALAELDRVERENPDRAETSEFAPLRNRRAACNAAIDAIRFAQIDANERAVAVSNTAELQKKWERKHGIGLTNADRYGDALEKVKTRKYSEAEALLAEILKSDPENLDALLLRAAAQSGSGDSAAARKTLESAAKAHPKSYLPRYNLAHLLLRTGDPAAARKSYEAGRAAGGPRNVAIEGLLDEADRKAAAQKENAK